MLLSTTSSEDETASNCVAGRSYNRLRRRLLQLHLVNAPLRSEQAVNGTDEAEYVDTCRQPAAQLLADKSRHGTMDSPAPKRFTVCARQWR